MSATGDAEATSERRGLLGVGALAGALALIFYMGTRPPAAELADGYSDGAYAEVPSGYSLCLYADADGNVTSYITSGECVPDPPMSPQQYQDSFVDIRKCGDPASYDRDKPQRRACMDYYQSIVEKELLRRAI